MPGPAAARRKRVKRFIQTWIITTLSVLVIAAVGAAIVGVSMDSRDAHRKFIADFALNFPLLSDRDATICKAYGVARLGGWFPPKRVIELYVNGACDRAMLEYVIEQGADFERVSFSKT